MKIGLVKERKNNEYRVGLTPANVQAYTAAGHTVLVQKGAGLGVGFSDDDYISAGARCAERAEQVWKESEMIVKVKEPIASEYPMMQEGQILYTYLHLAADRPLTEALVEKHIRAVAYETITDKNGGLPCLTPMSEIAGRMSVQEGAKYLEKTFGGRGVLLSGTPGVYKAKVVILGAGTVGSNACKIAVGMGADVTVLDIDINKLTTLEQHYDGRIQTLYSTRENIAANLKRADLVIGAVLSPGRKAPCLVTRKDLKIMKPGAVIVDVAIDQGGCFETSHATTHNDPVYVESGIVHYCVSNMPGAVAYTATEALTNATLQPGLMIAGTGLERAAAQNPDIASGINCFDGKVTCKGVAEAHGMPFWDVKDLLRGRV